jgi:hypothetical protein
MKPFAYRLMWPIILYFSLGALNQATAQPVQLSALTVKRCSDFEPNGGGDNTEWNKAEWNDLIQLDTAGKIYSTKFKILYSSKGVYVLFKGDDDKISTKYDKDFGDLYMGDVFEVFFHTDPNTPIYFEYEVNQLGKELVLLIPNINGRNYGWLPWRYEKERSVKKMLNVVGGKPAMGAPINSWTAELFFPYELFKPLGNVPPKSGTIWNANFYRLDYDTGKARRFAWSRVERHFHEPGRFGVIKFE